MENNETQTPTSEVDVKYTKAEREEFIEQFGPGAAVALESLRKQAGIKIKATRGFRLTKSID